MERFLMNITDRHANTATTAALVAVLVCLANLIFTVWRFR